MKPLNHLKWPVIDDDMMCGSDCWADLATVKNEAGCLTISLGMAADIAIPHEVIGDNVAGTPEQITALLMERILLDMARELVPELTHKIEVAMAECN